jgi:putative oxidoreductase
MTDIIEPKRLVVPFVAPLYRGLAPYVYPLVRISLGAILMPYGYDKLFRDAAAATARNPFMIKLFPNPLYGAYFIGCVEFFGGLLLVLGLLTQLAAGAIAIQMFVISFFILWPA